MQAITYFSAPWGKLKNALADLPKETVSPQLQVLSQVQKMKIWEEALSIMETFRITGELSSTVRTSSISQDIEGLLELIKEDVWVTSPDEVRQYLLNFPDIIEVVPRAVEAARKHLPKAQLILQVYRDPEIDDSYLTLEVRLKEYDESVMSRIEEAESEFIEHLVGKKGWLLLTTDFKEPVY